MSYFSPAPLAQLDYVLTDAMTFPGKDGHRVKLWTPDPAQRVDMSDKQAFMERFVDWHVEIMAREPFDILANTTWLPAGDDSFPERITDAVASAPRPGQCPVGCASGLRR